jgi:hypothetical protein
VDSEGLIGELFPPGVYFPSFGSDPISDQGLKVVRERLLGVAQAIPESHPDWARVLDIRLGQELVEIFSDHPTEASVGDVWCYLATVLLPGLVYSRFGGGTHVVPDERFLSGRRNAFQRLYLRSFVLGDILTTSGGGLSEDELVGLIDRNLSSDHRIARLVAHSILENKNRPQRRERFRLGMRRLQLELRVTDLGSFEDDELKLYMRRLFA